jgi:hypothetical protein
MRALSSQKTALRLCRFEKLQRKELIMTPGATGTRGVGPMDLLRKAVQPATRRQFLCYVNIMRVMIPN